MSRVYFRKSKLIIFLGRVDFPQTSSVTSVATVLTYIYVAYIPSRPIQQQTAPVLVVFVYYLLRRLLMVYQLFPRRFPIRPISEIQKILEIFIECNILEISGFLD